MLTSQLPDKTEMVSLDPLDTTGYLLLAARVDGGVGPMSPAKRELVNDLKARANQLRREMFANVAVLTARRMPKVPEVTSEPIGLLSGRQSCRYDVAVLIQAPTVDAARWLTADPAFAALNTFISAVASQTRVALVHNVRPNACEFGPCTRRVFMLINYIEGDDRELLPAWGWTHRRELAHDSVWCTAVRRALTGRPSRLSARTQPVFYGLA